MPELPEVETITRHLTNLLKNKTITDVLIIREKNVLNDKSFTIDPSQFGNTLGDIAGNTKDTANNTKKITDEDLKYLIDIAERDTINRFTTVPLTINMTNNNNIDSETDIDGIVDSLTKRLEEELEYISDGVHE